VRTLHYYDEIGLLVPAHIDECTGYRYYDETSLLRMQEILFYRELDFSLKSIGEMLSSPNYDTNKALKEQKKLLTLKKERLERLISAIDDAMKGENVMKAFDSSEFDKHKAEAKERWGKTDAYKEHEEEIIGFYNSIMEQYDPDTKKQELFTDDNIMRSLERDVLLRVVDNQWIDHLHNIDMLKEGIGLRAYGQKDPLIEYKKEAYDLFNKMMAEIQSNTVRYVFRAKFGIQFVSDDGIEVLEQ
jgi:preprotein translocase subunit SecA